MEPIKLCILTLTLALAISNSSSAPTESSPAETTEMAAELIDAKGTDEPSANLEETTPKADGDGDGSSESQENSGTELYQSTATRTSTTTREYAGNRSCLQRPLTISCPVSQLVYSYGRIRRTAQPPPPSAQGGHGRPE
ncbi:unnamed protein product [Nesidiocoris tenuis]|uniref:Uncharacterized protein n=1 Tax=Nesidiocoris tenuis TaxID=355587 RepID=A0A6H5GA04_9HEMI|nr:unnamed protein product [Nesidiocoris tenuis]